MTHMVTIATRYYCYSTCAHLAKLRDMTVTMVTTFSCLICSLEKSIPGLALSRSDRSSAPPNTGVTEELGGDRP